ncbi:hypothetical protein COCNU_scaffold002250G000010 [Cocos nucifera]|nr:hypothetical protein [Cocos nucifera]
MNEECFRARVEPTVTLFHYHFMVKRHPIARGWWYVIPKVPRSLDQSALEGSHEAFVKCLFNEVILSLLAPNISDLFPEEDPTNGEETIKMMVDGIPLTEGTKIFETTLGCTSKGKESITEVARTSRTMPTKKAKDQLSKAIGEASGRVEATEKKLDDAEAALMKSTKENARLLSINKVLEVKIEKLKARVVKAEAPKAEAFLAVRLVEEKASRAIDDFRMSKEFRKEKASFALDTYDEGKRVVHEEVGSKYPRMDLSFLDEILEASTFDSEDTS